MNDRSTQPNVVFNGSVIISGELFGVVIRTGDSTVLGKIATLTKSEKKRSPLSAEIHRFCHIISVLATITALIFFFFAIARGRNMNYVCSKMWITCRKLTSSTLSTGFNLRNRDISGMDPARACCHSNHAVDDFR